MHQRMMYMHVNFLKIRVCRSVKTVLTKIFANNRKLPKFATIPSNSNFEKIDNSQHASSYYVHIL